jgi:hypothetical protein
MRAIEDMRFSVDTTRDGKFVGRVYEFPDLRTKPKAKRLDAIDEIIALTSTRLAEIHQSRRKGASAK